MRVLVAGAGGVIGRQLVPLLRQRGREVLGATRREEQGDRLRDMGAEPVVCDALDAESIRRAVVPREPEVIVNELTALSASPSFMSPTRPQPPSRRLRVQRPARHLRR